MEESRNNFFTPCLKLKDDVKKETSYMRTVFRTVIEDATNGGKLVKDALDKYLSINDEKLKVCNEDSELVNQKNSRLRYGWI